MKRIVALGSVCIVAACGGGSESPMADNAFCQQALAPVAAFMDQARKEHPAPDDPRYGGTVVVGDYGELGNGMNSAVTSENTARQHQEFVNLMTLIRYDQSYQPAPYLAESWEISPDSTALTFHLRRDVLWHDGVRTDAHDVAFTWEAVTDPVTGYPNISDLEFYDGGPGSAEVLDDFTVRFHMRPHPEFIEIFRSLGILPAHLLGDVPHDQLRVHPYGQVCPVGNGPFVFESHRPQDRWVFTANPVFPEELGGRPFVDRYVFRVITEQTTLLTELLTENIDVYMGPAAEQAQLILDDPKLDLEVYESRQYNFVVWNSRHPQFADKRVRRALTMGTNREEMIAAVVQGYGSVANTGVPPHFWAYDPSVITPIPYDPTGARALLDEAGWKDRDGDGVRESADGTRMEFTIKYNPNKMRQQVAEIMQAQLAQIGVEAHPRVVEWTTLVDEMDSRDFDAMIMGWVTDFHIDDTSLFHSDRIDEPNAASGTHRPDIDRLLDKLAITADRDAARPLWTEYQRLIVDEQPYTYLYFPKRLTGVNKRVKGVIMDARGDWQNIKDWYLDPASRR
jgi:peptide/nickel transport system substrate-binding protein